MSRDKTQKRVWFLTKSTHVRPSIWFSSEISWGMSWLYLSSYLAHKASWVVSSSVWDDSNLLLPVARSSLLGYLLHTCSIGLQWGGRYPQNTFWTFYWSMTYWQKRIQIWRTQLDAISQTAHIYVINTLISPNGTFPQIYPSCSSAWYLLRIIIDLTSP